jgi:hypothetical protein
MQLLNLVTLTTLFVTRAMASVPGVVHLRKDPQT